MVIKIGINGFGRIGRVTFRTCLKNSNFQIGAINDPALDVDYICYLMKFDSTHGKLTGCVTRTSKNSISLNGKAIKVYREKQPSSIPWVNADIKYVIESSGMFTSFEKASGHLRSECVKGVIVTAPSLDVPMIIIGVNEHMFNADTKIISSASSTLYCLTPIIKILEDNFGVKEGFITSIHAMTPSLRPLDGLCIRGKHWRDHRSIHQNIIPAVTSACKALEKILPQVEDKFCGLAFRVPIVNVSLLDITIRLAKNTTLKEIAENVDRMSKSKMKNVVNISKDKAVSSDFIGDHHSCTLDVDSSIQLRQDFFKLICWYENEYSYACRIIDLIHHFEKVTKRHATTMFTTKSYDDILKISTSSECSKHFCEIYKTPVTSIDFENMYKDTIQHYEKPSEEFTRQSIKSIDLSSILGGKNWTANEWLFLNKQNCHANVKHMANHRRNPYTQCCSKDDLEIIYKNDSDVNLADGEKNVKNSNFKDLTTCKLNDYETSEIVPKRESLNRNIDSLKTIHMHTQKNYEQESVDDFSVKSDATRFRKLISGDYETSTCTSNIRTADILNEQSETHINERKGNSQGMTLKTAEMKEQPKHIRHQKRIKSRKSEDFKTNAVKTINRVIEELSQTMVEHFFSFNKKTNKTNKNSNIKNESMCKKHSRNGNIISEKTRIIINTNKNTNDIIQELQEKFANNKHQYLIYSARKSGTDKINLEPSGQSCQKENTIRKDLKVDDMLVSNDNVRCHDTNKKFEDGLKLQRRANETYTYFLQNEAISSPKKKVKRNTKQLSDDKLNRYSSTILTNDVNRSDMYKHKNCVSSTNFHSNFESTKNYTCFFEDVNSGTNSYTCEPENSKMEVIHMNYFETTRKCHESDPISIESSTNRSTFGNFNFYTDKEDLYDKLDSTSGTDSNNSFQMNEKKSQVIQLSDLTNSLDDITRLDKICQIIEISDELSDKLFSSLKEGQNQNGGKKWSFKDLCQKLKLDDFCNSVFEKNPN